MEQLYNYLPEKLVTFILVTLFSLLIGLSQRKISLKREGETTLFGTDRTFTFIGMLGYLLYILDPEEMHLFMGGGLILGILLGLNIFGCFLRVCITAFTGEYRDCSRTTVEPADNAGHQYPRFTKDIPLQQIGKI